MPMPEFKMLVDEIKREVHEISADELRRMKAGGEDFSLIDVREREDWYNGTIPGAQTIPRGVLELKIDHVTTDKDRKMVLYCGGGSRSALAAYMLQRMASGMSSRSREAIAGGRNPRPSKPRSGSLGIPRKGSRRARSCRLIDNSKSRIKPKSNTPPLPKEAEIGHQLQAVVTRNH